MNIKVASGTTSDQDAPPRPRPNVLTARAEFEPSEIQDLADAVPRLLELRARSNIDIRFVVTVELGGGDSSPDESAVADANNALKDVKDGFTAN